MVEIKGTKKEIDTISRLIVDGSWSIEDCLYQYSDIDDRTFISDGEFEFEYKVIVVSDE